MDIVFKLSALRRFLICSVVLLSLAGLAAEIADDVLDIGGPGLKYMFSLSKEQNVPTWFSTLLLFSCSICLMLISMAKRQARGSFVVHWSALALVFAYISLDEFVEIHEEMSLWFDLYGVLYFSWVIPAGIFVAVFGLSYLRFLGHLERAVRNRFILAGAIYVGGALFLDLPLGYWMDRAGRENIIFALIDLVAETMEMSGASLFLHTLVAYLSEPMGRFRISTHPSEAR